MPEIIKIKKGLDIPLSGIAQLITVKTECSVYGFDPEDFLGVHPKPNLKEGDSVKAGTIVFHDKDRPEIGFASPVSGVLKSIVRGDKRVIHNIIIESDGKQDYERFSMTNPSDLTKELITEMLLKSGCWPFIKQRPYGIIANPAHTPKSIFVSCFDTAPLAPDFNYILQAEQLAFKTGVEVLKKLTTGTVHLNVDASKDIHIAISSCKDVQINEFKGPHPAGNVGVQIHHIDPVNKGEVVWTISIQELITIGNLFEKGIYDASRLVAVTGSEATQPAYLKTYPGAQIQSLLKSNVKQGDVRIISGNALTGKKVGYDQYLGFYDTQLTLIPEGRTHEFLGWVTPGFGKFSFSRTFPSFLSERKSYAFNTNFHGGERAYVVTGEFEKVTPMDIYPLYLIKAILAQNIDQMERLGIYEVVPEDFALCEYICTSKTEIQSIVRDGILLMLKEMS